MTERDCILSGNYKALDALYARLKHAEDEAKGFEANWRLAIAERDKANELAAFSGVALNKALEQRNELRRLLGECSPFLSHALCTIPADVPEYAKARALAQEVGVAAFPSVHAAFARSKR